MTARSARLGRLPWQVAVLTMVGASVPVVALAADARLFVEMEGDIACPSRAVITQALMRSTLATHVVFGQASGEAAHLRLRSSRPDDLTVELSLGGGTSYFSRVLSARSDECEQLAVTAAQLVGAWLEEVSWNATLVTPRPSPPTPPMPPAATPDASVPAPVSSPVPSASSPTIAPSRGSPLAAALSIGPTYEPQARRLGVHVSAAVAARITPNWSLGLDVGVDAPSRAEASPGHVTVSTLVSTAFVDRRVYRGSAATLDVLGGLGGERITAVGTGYTQDATVTRYGLAGLLLLRFSRPLFGGIRGMLCGGVHLRAPARDIGIVGLGTILPLSPARPWVGVGLLWDPF
ncbi:MAG: hypothetical protein AAB426_00895 [Myxococcota bacterium]